MLLLVIGTLVGCRSRDPLEWKVDAENLNAYNKWLSYYAADLGESLQAEFTMAGRELALMTPGFHMPESPRDMTDEKNPFCRRINGCTVREILILYYMASNERIMGSIAINLDSITKLYKQISEAESKRAERSIPYYQAQIDGDREKIRRNEERLKQLRGGADK